MTTIMITTENRRSWREVLLGQAATVKLFGGFG
jgi:hypothetical protein